MGIFSVIMLIFLIGCAVSVSAAKNLLAAIIIFTAYSLVMAILWQMMNAPDMAITEAAVGAGITTVLFVLTLKRIGGAGK
ncbi:MAG TPA: hydrogenase subunit MbhD domain-containing protein [Clostridia bacterium]|nr:hydrogenase subunit MbhD domain-containing protein [Clostridia bacterium]